MNCCMKGASVFCCPIMQCPWLWRDVGGGPKPDCWTRINRHKNITLHLVQTKEHKEGQNIYSIRHSVWINLNSMDKMQVKKHRFAIIAKFMLTGQKTTEKDLKEYNEHTWVQDDTITIISQKIQNTNYNEPKICIYTGLSLKLSLYCWKAEAVWSVFPLTLDRHRTSSGQSLLLNRTVSNNINSTLTGFMYFINYISVF